MVSALGVGVIRRVLRFMGIPIFTLDTLHYEFETEEEDTTTEIGGGSTHDFERDIDPYSPDDRYDWEWEDKGFGFRGPQ